MEEWYGNFENQGFSAGMCLKSGKKLRGMIGLKGQDHCLFNALQLANIVLLNSPSRPSSSSPRVLNPRLARGHPWSVARPNAFE